MASWWRRQNELPAPGPAHVLAEAWRTTLDSNRADAFLGAVAEQLCEAAGSTRLGIYARDESRLVRVGMAVREAPEAATDRPFHHVDEPEAALPASVSVKAPKASTAASWVELPGSSVWLLSDDEHLAAFLQTDRSESEALAAAVGTVAGLVLDARKHRNQELDARVRRTIMRAAMDQPSTVDMFLGAAVTGLAGQRGFVGLWQPGSEHLEVLACRGDITPTLQGLALDQIADVWLCTVSTGEFIAPKAKAIYALARGSKKGVVICVVASTQEAAAISLATSQRVDQAVEIITALQDAEDEAARARARGSSILEALAAMLDSDPASSGHHERVRDVAAWAAGRLELSEQQLVELERATAIHDVGRVGFDVQDTALEFLHPEVGSVLLDTFGEDEEVVRLVSLHHERHDGLGFPHGVAPQDDDRALWALVAAEGIVELAESDGAELSTARERWLDTRAAGALPPAVLQRLRRKVPPS